MEFTGLKGYRPTKNKDGFEPFKGTFNAGVNYARIEIYDGEREDLIGKKFFRYELEIVDDVEYTGRKLWKTYDLSNDDSQKKLANSLFTVGLEFKSEEELEVCAEQFCKMKIVVRAYYFPSKENKDEKIQAHVIKGLATEGATGKAVPF